MQKLAFDRWNFRHLLPWLLRAGFTEQMVKERFVEFGQGVVSMSPALRDPRASPVGRRAMMCVTHTRSDPPPLKWSDLRYVFDIKEDCNGKEAIQA